MVTKMVVEVVVGAGGEWRVWRSSAPYSSYMYYPKQQCIPNKDEDSKQGEVTECVWPAAGGERDSWIRQKEEEREIPG